MGASGLSMEKAKLDDGVGTSSQQTAFLGGWEGQHKESRTEQHLLCKGLRGSG